MKWKEIALYFLITHQETGEVRFYSGGKLNSTAILIKDKNTPEYQRLNTTRDVMSS